MRVLLYLHSDPLHRDSLHVYFKSQEMHGRYLRQPSYVVSEDSY